MKMRFYCQLAFATARLPCIQIRLPSRGRTERDWFQTKLSFVTKWLRLKKSTWFASQEVMPIGFFALSMQDCKGTNELCNSPKTRSEPLVLHTLNTVLPEQSRADGYSPYWPMGARTTENKGILSQELRFLGGGGHPALLSALDTVWRIHPTCLAVVVQVVFARSWEGDCWTRQSKYKNYTGWTVLAALVSRVAVPPFHPSKTFLVIARSNPGSFPCLCVCLLHIPGVTKQEPNLLYFASWYLEASCSLWATPCFLGTFTSPCLSLSFCLYLHIHINTTGAHAHAHMLPLYYGQFQIYQVDKVYN